MYFSLSLWYLLSTALSVEMFPWMGRIDPGNRKDHFPPPPFSPESWTVILLYCHTSGIWALNEICLVSNIDYFTVNLSNPLFTLMTPRRCQINPQELARAVYKLGTSNMKRWDYDSDGIVWVNWHWMYCSTYDSPCPVLYNPCKYVPVVLRRVCTENTLYS